MTRILLKGFFALLLLSNGVIGATVTQSSFPPRQSSGTPSCKQIVRKKEPRATGAVEVNYYGMFRSQINDLSILYYDNANGTLGVPANQFHTIPLKYDSGIRAMVEFTPNWVYTVQFLYMGLFHWSTSKEFTDPGNRFGVPTSPFTTNDWNLFQTLKYQYKSSLNSYDFSLWYNLSPRFSDYFSFSMIFGGRHIDLRDSIMLTCINSPNLNHSKTKIKNEMYGGQFGLDLEWSASKRITWEMQAKLGAYSNYIKKIFWVFDQNDIVEAGSINIHVNRTSYSADFLPSLMIRLDPLYFRIGYEALFLYHLALAPAQFEKSKTQDAVDLSNHIFIQGFYIGAGWQF